MTLVLVRLLLVLACCIVLLLVYPNDPALQAGTVSVCFDNISLYLEHPLPVKTILSRASGCLCENRLTAIMGHSGSGKSSLLSALIDQSELRMTGSISVTQLPPHWVGSNQSFIAAVSSLVPQQDIMHDSLTVSEILQFSARMRLPPWRGFAYRNILLEDTLQKLRLKEVQDARVGSTLLRGISGGQRKRLSIGIELVSDPSVLFLDEPTSGLDDSSSFELIELLSRLVKREHRMVVAVLHQPSLQIYNFFDDVLVFGSGGVILYAGQAPKLPLYLREVAKYTKKVDEAPANILLRLASSESVGKYANLWETAVRSEWTLPCQSAQNSILVGNPNLLQQTWLQFVRSLTLYWRGPLAAHLAFYLAISVVLGTLRRAAGVSDVAGNIFVVCLLLSLLGTMTALSLFSTEKDVQLREQRSGLNVISYWLGKLMLALVINILSSTMFSAAYLRSSSTNPRFGPFAQAVFCHQMTAQSIATAVSIWTGDEAQVAVISISGVHIIFAGFAFLKQVIRNATKPLGVPGALLIFYHMSPVRYLFQLLLIEACLPLGTSGDSLLRGFEFKNDDATTCYYFLLGFTGVFQLLGLCALGPASFIQTVLPVILFCGCTILPTFSPHISLFSSACVSPSPISGAGALAPNSVPCAGQTPLSSDPSQSNVSPIPPSAEALSCAGTPVINRTAPLAAPVIPPSSTFAPSRPPESSVAPLVNPALVALRPAIAATLRFATDHLTEPDIQLKALVQLEEFTSKEDLVTMARGGAIQTVLAAIRESLGCPLGSYGVIVSGKVLAAGIDLLRKWSYCPEMATAWGEIGSLDIFQKAINVLFEHSKSSRCLQSIGRLQRAELSALVGLGQLAMKDENRVPLFECGTVGFVEMLNERTGIELKDISITTQRSSECFYRHSLALGVLANLSDSTVLHGPLLGSAARVLATMDSYKVLAEHDISSLTRPEREKRFSSDMYVHAAKGKSDFVYLNVHPPAVHFLANIAEDEANRATLVQAGVMASVLKTMFASGKASRGSIAHSSPCPLDALRALANLAEHPDTMFYLIQRGEIKDLVVGVREILAMFSAHPQVVLLANRFLKYLG